MILETTSHRTFLHLPLHPFISHFPLLSFAHLRSQALRIIRSVRRARVRSYTAGSTRPANTATLSIMRHRTRRSSRAGAHRSRRRRSRLSACHSRRSERSASNRGSRCTRSNGTAEGRAGDGRRERARLDIHAGEVPILGAILRVTISRQTEHAQMPIGTIRRRADRDGRMGQRQGVGAGRVPEGDGVGGEVDLVGDVVPDGGSEGRAPLGLAVDHPLQVGVAGAGLAADPAGLHLGEVGLEEADLVLQVDAGRVGGRVHHAEVVEDVARVDGRGRLRDQLGAPHRLPVPEGGRVDGEFEALVGHFVGGVLVAG